MKNIIKACLNRPVFVLSSVLLIFLSFALSITKMPLTGLPEVDFPRLLVETRYYGLPAKDIRRVVTIPIEDALSAVKGIEKIKSVSRDGASIIQLDFIWGTKISAAAVSVRETLDALYATLPEGVEKPTVIQSDPELEAHAIIAVKSKNNHPVFESNFAEYELRGRLRRIEGVGEIILLGAKKEEVRVDVDTNRSVLRGITANNLSQIIAMETMDVPAGSVREGDMEIVVVSEGRPENTQALSKLALNNNNNYVVLDDVASIQNEIAERKSAFIFNNEELTALEIYKRHGASPLKLSSDIKKLVKEVNSEFERDIELFIAYDNAPEIKKNLGDLGFSASLGALAVILILILFIKNIRMSVIASLSIPISACFTFAVLALLGRSLNNMSLTGIALGVGLVSDASVITVSVLFRRFNGYETPPNPSETADAVYSVSASSFGGSITTMVVFVPIVFLPGALGALFGDMAIAIAVSVFAGWIYAQFVLPVLFRMFFKMNKITINKLLIVEKIENKLNKIEKVLYSNYAKLLRYAIRNTRRILLIAGVLCLSGIVVLISRPYAFISKGALKNITVTLDFPSGMLTEETLKEAKNASELLSALPCVKNVYAIEGAENADIRRRSHPDYKKEVWHFNVLLSNNTNSKIALPIIQNALLELPAYITSRAFSTEDKKEKILGASSGLAFVSLDKTEEIAREQAEEALKTLTTKAINAKITPRGEREGYKIIPKREIMAYLNVTGADIAQNAMTETNGAVPLQLEIEGRPIDVRVKGAQKENNSIYRTLNSIPVAMTESGPIFLGTVSNIARDFSPLTLLRIDRSDALYINIDDAHNYSKKNIASIIKNINGIIEANENALIKYSAILLVTVILVLLLLYLTLGAQFESWTHPVIIMLSIPFALMGAGPALLIAGEPLDSGAVIGIVTLAGIVVSNGIVLYEISNEHIKEGMPPVKAVYIGAKERAAPLLVTMLTSFIVLLPLMLSKSAQLSMAAVMLGGLITSTALSLFALPAVFARVLKR